MEEEYYQLDRAALTEVTLLEIEMENCVDPQEYNELYNNASKNFINSSEPLSNINNFYIIIS